MANAKPGDRTGGDKDKEAAHRTPAQTKRRNGPDDIGMGQSSMKLPEQAAQASGGSFQGDLRGGGASGIDGEQHGLSNAPLGRIEGGVEPCSLVLGSEKQSWLQEGATVVASPVEQTGTSARKAHESTDTPLGGTMPEGTANVQPKQALTRALGAMGSALPEAVQTNTQTVQNPMHVGMRGGVASIAPGLTGTPLGGTMPLGTANVQPNQALTCALGAMGSALPEAVQTNIQPVQNPMHVGMRGGVASIAPGLTGTPLGGAMSLGTANVHPNKALTRALGAKGRALSETVQTTVQTEQSAAHADMSGTGASIAPEKKDTPLGGMMYEGNASLQPQQALTCALGAMGSALPEAVQTNVQPVQNPMHVGMRGGVASIAPGLTGTPLGGTMPLGTANVQPNQALTCALGAMGSVLSETVQTTVQT